MNKWDYDGSDQCQPLETTLPPVSSKSNPIEAATEAAARINALLIAQGLLKPSQVSVPNKPKSATTQQHSAQQLEVRTFYCKVPNWASSSSFTNKIIAEVDINSVLPACRNNLTRTTTQEEISKFSGAAIITKGRYMNEEERARAEPGDRPLYLCLEATTQEAIDKAISRIRELIDGKDVRRDRRFGASNFGVLPPVPPVTSSYVPPGDVRLHTSTVSGLSSSMAYVSDKLLVGLEHAPPNFDVKNRLLGPGGSYLQHIMTETMAKVMLRGRGSGFIEPDLGREAQEPMYIFIQHASTQGLQEARQLAKNLIETHK